MKNKDRSASKYGVVLVVVIILSFYVGYLYSQYKAKRATDPLGLFANEQKRIAAENICSEENNNSLNYYLNAETNIFDKSRAIVAMQDNPCLQKSPKILQEANSIKRKEAERITTTYKRLTVENTADFEKINGTVGFEDDEKKLNYAILEKGSNELLSITLAPSK